MVSLVHFTAPFAFASLHPSYRSASIVLGGECRSDSAASFTHTSLRVYTGLRGYAMTFCQSQH